MSNDTWTVDGYFDVGMVLTCNSSEPRFSMEVIDLLGGFDKFRVLVKECKNNLEEFNKVVERYRKLKAFA